MFINYSIITYPQLFLWTSLLYSNIYVLRISLLSTLCMPENTQVNLSWRHWSYFLGKKIPALRLAHRASSWLLESQIFIIEFGSNWKHFSLESGPAFGMMA